MDRIVFRHEILTNCTDEYPSDLLVEVSCGGGSTLMQVVQTFKMFLKACEYSEELIEGIYYENTSR